jgi:prevent-host-death family protein
MSSPARISASEANRSFSKLLGRVKNGEAVDITSHGKVIAEIRPKQQDAEAERARRLKAWEKHRAILQTREVKVVGPWTRAELYERD